MGAVLTDDRAGAAKDGRAPTGARAPTGPAWERLTEQLAWYDSRASSCQGAYRACKVATLIVAAVVPVVAALQVQPAVTASLAAVVVVLEGVQQLYQWHTNWVLYRSTAESLKHERHLYLAAAGPYAGKDRDRVLAERVEGMVSQEHAKWTDAHTSTGTRSTAVGG